MVEVTQLLYPKEIHGELHAPPVHSIYDFEKRIKEGEYGWVDPNITKSDDVIKWNAYPSVYEAYNVKYKLFHFNQYFISSEEVIDKMENEGFKPGNLNELLALGKDKPDIQRKFPIVELSSVFCVRNTEYYEKVYSAPMVVMLDYSDEWYGRELSTTFNVCGWREDRNYHFLAVLRELKK